MGAGIGEGEGSGRGGSPLWMVVWFLLLWFIGLPVAGFCAGWYILVLPFTVCIESLTPITDLLLKGAQATHFCAKHMMAGTPVGDAFK